nr:ATP-binding cassette domain-containing protein [Desulfuromusa kysingii]
MDICDLHKYFVGKDKTTTHALHGISLQALRGQVTGLVGVDGAGKTTLIRIATGLLLPSSGSVKVLGLDSVADTLEIQSLIGYMPQKFGLYQDLTVVENMALYADLQGVPPKERAEKYARLLTMTDLQKYTKRRAGALSGGMKQKLGLACALIKSPALLLLDEPTVGVDPVSRRELWKIVYELVKKEGIGVIVSTAYMDEAERCDHVIALHQGEILAEGTPQDFIKRMHDRVYTVSPTADDKVRQIYTRLATHQNVVDTTIRAGKVRIVLKTSNQNAAVLFEDDRLQVQPVEPSFEDAFTAMIPAAAHDFQPDGIKPENRQASGTESEVVIDIRKLQKNFGHFAAVNNLNFSVRRGEIFGLLGPNGAGKSTTFRMLCGLLPASSGDISVAGYNLHRSRARARSRLGYMAQQFSLYGQLSVRENLRFFGKAYGLSAKHLHQRIEWAYAEFGLEEWQNKAAGMLPGGYKQRLAMAAALLHEPEILFLDEPTSGVDLFARREFWLRINSFAEQGVTVVVTTHFMEEAEYCDRMLIMSQGETLAIGTPTDIRTLACTAENPQPTMDDAFIALAEGTISTSSMAQNQRQFGGAR